MLIFDILFQISSLASAVVSPELKTANHTITVTCAIFTVSINNCKWLPRTITKSFNKKVNVAQNTLLYLQKISLPTPQRAIGNSDGEGGPLKGPLKKTFKGEYEANLKFP
jgi:hypothetical protein